VAGVAQNDTFECWYVIVITAVGQDDVTVVDELVVRRIDVQLSGLRPEHRGPGM
jgi:hypothetical protein